jgi:hypothetical protein
VVDRRNPLAFDMSSELAFCGRLNDMVLRFRGMEMRLFLDIREYRHYAIDSPPFQQGTFHLRTTVCDEGARAHRPDSRDPPRCRLAGNAWVGPDSAWVRHPTPVFLSGGPLPRPIAACGREEVRVITSRADWAELWRAHPEALRSNRLVEFDFRYQALLAIYSQLRHPGLTSESLRVDPRGDLTVHLAPGAVDPAHCSVTFVVINRSGVRSVNGNPIGEGQR